MAPSATPDSSSSSPTSDNRENNLQPFFVLHKALPRKSERKATGPVKTRRKIDLSPASPKSSEKSKADRIEEYEDCHYKPLRIEAFDLVWSRIETSIQDVLRDINNNVFNEIHHWVSESFTAIRSFERPNSSKVNRLYPIVTDISCKQLFTGLVFTKNVEFVDDLLTFEELGLHLKSHGCHVANLSSLEFSAKNGIGGCLKSLLRQFVRVTPDAADIAILASWYSERENCDNPLVVIIDDLERCNGSVLAEFLLMLSEWVVSIPIILIMGVATTVDAPRNILPSNALQRLCPCKFTLGSPAERMDAIIKGVLLKPCFGFNVGYKVAGFLRNYFLRQDGTLTSFIRALKIACVKHFLAEPLSFLLEGILDEDSHYFWSEKCALLPEVMLKSAFDLPSCKRDKMAEQTGENLANGLSELKRLRKNWISAVLCLYEAGKCHKIQLLDIFCEALDPDFFNKRASDHQSGLGLRKGGFICQAVRKVRDLPVARLCQLIKIWEKNTDGITEIHSKVKELLSMLKFEDNDKSLKQDLSHTSKRPTSRSHLYKDKGTKAVNEKAAILLECMVRDYLQPIECTPFHEIICFSNVDILQSALIGDPRRTIQVDLLKSHNYLQCSCCSKSNNSLLPSMHDTSIMYTLAQEHGDLINLHDWYQSFKGTITCPTIKGKHKMKQSPLSKKRKTNESPDISEASIQARFCRAVTELQITGLLRMPSKRRPDCVQRVAFGL
ncbi:hypothetical protein HHK36_011398 [Tetracentron sinense]|uniref:Origin recognition complex subunit 3 n=1 Tax=Tetracentron sinense TaxID=13715 RepID=A0A834ZG94_TETSI|nr:hypothetical protein HHK36_011398 [Tetracentron sinense]